MFDQLTPVLHGDDDDDDDDDNNDDNNNNPVSIFYTILYDVGSNLGKRVYHVKTST
jgi:hypothetical protein